MRKSTLLQLLSLSAAATLMFASAALASGTTAMNGVAGPATLYGTIAGVNPATAHPYAQANVSTNVGVDSLTACATYNGAGNCLSNVPGTKSSFQSYTSTSPDYWCGPGDVAAGSGSYNDAVKGAGNISGQITSFCN